MFLSKRNNIYYLYYFEDQVKRKISTKCRSKSEALKFVTQLKNQSKKKSIIPKRLNDIVTQYIEQSKVIHKENTTRAIKLTFRFFQEYIGNPLVKDISTIKLNEYIQHRIINHSVYQARKDVINLRRFFNQLEIDEHIQDNPFKRIKSIRIPDKQPLFFTKEEFQKLIEIVKEKDLVDLYTFAIHTGLRLDEIRFLKNDNIQDRNVILHNHSKLTKTNKVRSVPLNNTAYSIISNRLKHNSEYVFTYKGFMVGKRYPTQKLKDYITKLGLNPKLNFHSFRHTNASWLAQKGVSIYNISKILGHSSVSVTEKYSHLSPQNLQETVNLLDN